MLGPDHPSVATALNNLAGLYQVQSRYGDAEPLFKRTLNIREKALGPDHPDVGTSLNNLAVLYVIQSDWARAANYWRRSTDLIIRRSRRGVDMVGESLTGKGKSEAERSSFQFWGLVKVALRVFLSGPGAADDVSDEMFRTAQWAQGSEAAASLAQMAVRGAKGNDDLAHLVRERQDLVWEWQGKDKLLITARSNPPDKRNAVGEAALSDRLAAIDARMVEIDKTLAKEFPDYSALASPEPLSISEVQSQLHDSEALVLFLDTAEAKPTPEETFIWTVTKTDSRWVRIDLGTKALRERVTALRCGLDRDGEWQWSQDKNRWLASSPVCKTQWPDGLPRGEALPFDIAKAHELYQALFGEIADLLKNPDGTGKQLLIVPSGPLTQLPFQVLVTSDPDRALTGSDAYRNAAWLARSNAITMLPAVSSLKALRGLAKKSHASKLFIGFGNPLLDGKDASYAALAKAARERQQCPKEQLHTTGLIAARGGIVPLLQQNRITDVAYVRAQTPLPETADELCAVAHDLGAGDDDIYLGASASEMGVKALSASGALAQYRTIEFATHGAIAGEMSGSAEPGLLLTPPTQGSEEDDGYLSASEIAGLKLDADWVILSACNTAAAGTEGAEALSGLARSFFYAGARSLLVSHWSVNSNATVKLITKAVAELKADPKIGRAEAMRRSMLALIDQGKPYEAHPAYWAPFVVVGEGGPTSMAAVPVAAPLAPSRTTTGAISATPEEPNSKVAPAPSAEPALAPAAPVTDATPEATTQLPPKASTLPKDKQASKTKAAAAKKAQSKPKPDDWITSIFGQ